MLHIENAIVIKETEHVKIGFLPLTLEEFTSLDEDNTNYYNGQTKEKEFKEKYSISISDLIMHGDVTEVDSELMSNYIDNVTIKESEIDKFKLSYKCFCGEKHGLDYKKTILHGSVIDSWNCLLTYACFPKYAMIINLKSYEKTI